MVQKNCFRFFAGKSIGQKKGETVERMKKAGHTVTGSFWRCKLNSAGNLARAQAAGAGVDVLGRTVYNSLYTFHVGLPSTVRPTMRVGNLDAERNALATTIALCHLLHLLLIKSLEYNTKD